MTVSLMANIHRWVGLSTDTKPTSGPVGSTFFEVNTGQNWIWNGTDWIEDLTLIYAFTEALRERGR